MNSSGLRTYVLKPGFIFYTADPTMILTVLGSSVAMTFYDRERRAGGMNHFVYPWLGPDAEPTALFARPAVMQLIRLFHHSGTEIDKIEAHIIGGASPSDLDGESAEIGLNNVEAAVRMLEHYGIPVTGQEVGGRHGRKVLFNTSTGELMIAKVDRIRKSDWYPEAVNGVSWDQAEVEPEDDQALFDNAAEDSFSESEDDR